MKLRRLAAIAFVVAGLSGCTTVVDHMVDNINDVIGVKSANQQAESKSHVLASANVVLHAEKHVFNGVLPAKIPLKHESDNGWNVTSYTMRISLRGYYPAAITLRRTTDGWHVSNYLGLGKVIGWVILNPANGGIYTLSPGQLSTASSGEKYAPNSNHIWVLTIDSVPKPLRSEMTLVEYLSAKKSNVIPNGRK